MSLQHCSLALDADESSFESEAPLTLVVNKRYDLLTNALSSAQTILNEVVELGGTITVSF